MPQHSCSVPRPRLEIADIFRRFGRQYRERHLLPLQQLRLMRAIETCRTAALGGHVERCNRCGYRRNSYNSCRNRHCPKCQNTERAAWVQRRKAELLPIQYFHIVFTIPEQLNPLALQNKTTLYQILFQASAQTLLTIAADPKHLGARIGFFSVLHTWSQTLLLHPHMHCVVTGGGLKPDGSAWVGCRPGFFLSVRVLSRLFRRLFLEALQDAFRNHQLQFHGDLQVLPNHFPALLQELRTKEWVVYAKPPFGGPQQVVDYLGRYTHRVAIANPRLEAIQGDKVRFQYKDYRSQDRFKKRHMTLAADEFMRRFLLHTIPLRFARIRYYGLLSGRNKKRSLARCKELLNVPDLPLPSAEEIKKFTTELLALAALCPHCGQGQMIRIEVIAAIRFPRQIDSS